MSVCCATLRPDALAVRASHHSTHCQSVLPDTMHPSPVTSPCHHAMVVMPLEMPSVTLWLHHPLPGAAFIIGHFVEIFKKNNLKKFIHSLIH